MKLFEPVSLGFTATKNGPVMTAMSTGPADRGGRVTDNLFEYYVMRAAGGATMITVEENSIHPHLPHVQNASGVFSDYPHPGLKGQTGRLHRKGAHCSPQNNENPRLPRLNHFGVSVSLPVETAFGSPRPGIAIMR
jgi:2,4-dienoyl-CoA reductase-like NADH-dependent reductase (Old Yellow Enzyme family)